MFIKTINDLKKKYNMIHNTEKNNENLQTARREVKDKIEKEFGVEYSRSVRKSNKKLDYSYTKSYKQTY